MRRRRATLVLIISTALLAFFAATMPEAIRLTFTGDTMGRDPVSVESSDMVVEAKKSLDALEVRGRAPKIGYSRAEFGDGWALVRGCSTRDIILHRDLQKVELNDKCQVVKGELVDPYTSELVQFSRAQSSIVQIDHVVALSDAWQKGAQKLSYAKRVQLANDPLELLAVSGEANQQKSDADAASWLPKNKAFRCEYVARQVVIKKKYNLWVTRAEYDTIKSILQGC